MLDAVFLAVFQNTLVGLLTHSNIGTQRKCPVCQAPHYLLSLGQSCFVDPRESIQQDLRSIVSAGINIQQIKLGKDRIDPIVNVLIAHNGDNMQLPLGLQESRTVL